MCTNHFRFDVMLLKSVFTQNQLKKLHEHVEHQRETFFSNAMIHRFQVLILIL